VVENLRNVDGFVVRGQRPSELPEYRQGRD